MFRADYSETVLVNDTVKTYSENMQNTLVFVMLLTVSQIPPVL